MLELLAGKQKGTLKMTDQSWLYDSLGEVVYEGRFDQELVHLSDMLKLSLARHKLFLLDDIQKMQPSMIYKLLGEEHYAQLVCALPVCEWPSVERIKKSAEFSNSISEHIKDEQLVNALNALGFNNMDSLCNATDNQIKAVLTLLLIPEEEKIDPLKALQRAVINYKEKKAKYENI